MFVVCSLIIIPFIGAIHVALTGVKSGSDVRKIRKLSLMYTCITYYISIMMWIEFDLSKVGIQIVSEFSDWEMFNIAFGVDGLSLFFVILTALTIPIAIISGYYMEDKKQKLYLSLILLFSGFIISVFLSLDLIIFYVSFEAVLIPLTLLVGIYGGWRRISAAYQLFVRHCGSICQVCITNRNYHHITTRSEWGLRENRRLSKASLLEALKYLNKLTIVFAQRVLSKVKTILFEIKFPVPSQIREQFCFDRLFKIHVIWGIGITWVIIFARSLVKWIKGMSWWPKGSKSTNVTTMGWPKGCKTYGHRVGVVPDLRVTFLGYSLGNARAKGRPAVFNVSNSRSYSTGGTKNVANAIDSLAQRSSERQDKVVDRKLYKMLCSEEFIILAYNNLKSRQGNITPGIVNERISNGFILKLSQELRSETFQFTPGRGIQITQAKGGARPLTIAYTRDKIVQEAIRILLNAIYEPTFLESSHGFRPNRGCHTALEAIKQKFKSASWIMEGDISKCFDSIDHQRLMNLIENKILDKQFTKLIWKSLRCGYFEFARYELNIVGTPQGSIISPILSNIYIHQLDVEIQKIKDRFDKGTRPRANKEYQRISYLMREAKIAGDLQQVQERFKELQNIPYTDYSDPQYRRLNYVRYAESWVVGIRGSKAEAREIISQITAICNDQDITINQDKTKITNMITETAVFLGTNIQRSSHQKYPSKGGFYKQRCILPLNLTVSLDRIRSKLHQTSFIKNGQPNPRYLWIPLNHRQILVLYNSVYRGFTNYYSFALNYNDLASLLQFVLKSSCAKLLAAKYSLDSQAKVYKRYGSSLTDPVSGQTFVKPEDSTHVLGFKKTAKPEISTLYADKIYIASLENLVCSHCQSNYRVEIRHIRFIKGLNPKVSHLDKIIIKANRKQIPLCRSCNMKQHEQDNVKNGEPYELKGSRTVRERGKSIFFWGHLVLVHLYTLFGSLPMLLSFLNMYTMTNTTNIAVLSLMSPDYHPLIWLGIFIGLAVKTPLVPFHLWLKTAHAEANCAVSVVLAGLVLKLATYAHIRILIQLIPEQTHYFQSLVLVISLISIIYTAFICLRQTDFKQLVAYSSINHIGIVCLGLYSNTLTGVEGGVLLSISHGAVSPALFILVGGVIYDRYHDRTIRYYRGLATYMPLFSIFFLIFTLGNMATPLTGNWTGEFISLAGAFQTHPIITILASTSIVISACYSIYLYNRICFGSWSRYLNPVIDLTRLEFNVLIPLLVLIIALGLYPNIVLDYLHVSCSSLIY